MLKLRFKGQQAILIESIPLVAFSLMLAIIGSWFALTLFVLAHIISFVISIFILARIALIFIKHQALAVVSVQLSPYGSTIEAPSRHALIFHPIGSQILITEAHANYGLAAVFLVLNFILNHFNLIPNALAQHFISAYIAITVGNLYRNMLVPAINKDGEKILITDWLKDSIFWSNIILFALFTYQSVLRLGEYSSAIPVLIFVSTLFVIMSRYLLCKLIYEPIYKKASLFSNKTVRAVIDEISSINSQLIESLKEKKDYSPEQEGIKIFANQTVREFYLRYLSNGDEKFVVIDKPVNDKNGKSEVLGLIDVELFTRWIQFLAAK